VEYQLTSLNKKTFSTVMPNQRIIYTHSSTSGIEPTHVDHYTRRTKSHVYAGYVIRNMKISHIIKLIKKYEYESGRIHI
jgi:ribonucleotide reductase alpha subunit